MSDKASINCKPKIGDIISGQVVKHEAYGIFVDINSKYLGLIQITDFPSDTSIDPSFYPPIGSTVRAKVVAFRENNQQVWLSMKHI